MSTGEMTMSGTVLSDRELADLAQRDRFVLSTGHNALALYAVMALREVPLGATA